MESMNVQEMTDRLKVRYKNISDNTKKIWDKSIKWIDKTNVADVDDDLAAEWLERAETAWGESTVKARVGFLKGLWNKARKKKLYKGENPWIDLDDGLVIARREPELHPWEYYEYYHNDPMFVCLWYTGMRIGELAGIYPENIYLDKTIPYFDIKPQENRPLKNLASCRQVPIHPACLPYVYQLKFSKAKHPGWGWSYRFRKNMGLPSGHGAHSIRHSFISRMRLLNCHPATVDRIVGHQRKTETDRYGIFPLELLRDEIYKLGDLHNSKNSK